MPRKRKATKLSRREAIKAIAGAAGAAAGFPIVIIAAPRAIPSLPPAAKASASAITYAPRFFNSHQMETLAALAETILPTDQHSPGARAAGVRDYIDEIVADSEQDQKDLWTRGLAAVDKMVEQQYGKKFVDCAQGRLETFLRNISANEIHPETLEERFFVALKRAVINGYYTSAIGIHKELEYQGNTALSDFPGCQHEEHGKL